MMTRALVYLRFMVLSLFPSSLFQAVDGFCLRPTFRVVHTRQDRVHKPVRPSLEKAASPRNPEEVGLRGLFPPSVAFQNGTLAVDDIHTLYYEVHGRGGENDNDSQKPILNALFLHGGPGAGCFPNHARFFNPDIYRVVLFDQRGAGRSTPRGEVRQNTLLDLVYDCERLRFHLGVSQWDVVMGGSWGAALAVAYAQEFPSSLRSIVLRGVCLMRAQEVDWMFSNNGGMAKSYPDLWESFASAVNSPEHSPRDALHAYYDRLLGCNPAIRLAAAKAWMQWEFNAFTSSSKREGDEFYRKAYAPVAVCKDSNWKWQDGSGTDVSLEVLNRMEIDTISCEEAAKRFSRGLPKSGVSELHEAFARPLRSIAKVDSGNQEELSPEAANYVPSQNMLTCFYSVNNLYSMNNINLLDPTRLANLQNIPCIAVHGALDSVCPIDTALELQENWPLMELRVPTESGHSMYDVAITNQLICATDLLSRILRDDVHDRR